MALPELGVWIVTATMGEYSFDQEVEVFRYGITKCWALANKPFYDCTPAEIQTIAKSGMASQYWNIGDKHQIKLTTEEIIYVKIADFNHDVAPDGRTIPLTIIMENSFNTTRSMNPTATNAGGWPSCQFRIGTLPGIRSTFPEEWLSIITTASKTSGFTNGSFAVTDDDFWLLSEIEVFGAATNTYSGEGTLYPIFTDASSRISTTNGNPLGWWERSATRSSVSGNYFGLVESTGTVSTHNASSLRGIRLGFCVG